MAIDYGYEKGAKGALFSNFYDADSALMMQDPNSEGGFCVFGRQGEEGTGYTANASAANAVARVVELTPTIAAAAAGGKVSVTIGDKTFEATSTAATSTVATIIDDLVSAINNATTGSPLFGATDGTTKLTLTAKTAGAAANAVSITAASTDTGVVVASPTTNKTDGADAVTAGFFKGIAIRNAFSAVKHEGNEVAICRKGKIWVQVSGSVSVGETAYFTAAGVISSSSTNGTAFGKFVTNSTANDGLAVVELA